MGKEVREYVALQLRSAASEYAEMWGNVAKACRAFCVCRASFYRRKPADDAEGVAGLKRKRPIAKNHPNRIPDETIQKVLELRTKRPLGPQRIVWYMDRYHGIRTGFQSVYRILVRHGLNRLPHKADRRSSCR